LPSTSIPSSTKEKEGGRKGGREKETERERERERERNLRASDVLWKRGK
jgi:hypothetical protein